MSRMVISFAGRKLENAVKNAVKNAVSLLSFCELGGDGLAADGLAAPLWAGAAAGGWLSAKQACQAALGS